MQGARDPEENQTAPTTDDTKPRRCTDTSWGVGPWPVQTPDPAHDLRARVSASPPQGQSAITLHPAEPR